MKKKPDWLIDFDLDDFRCHCQTCVKIPDRPHTKIEVIRAVQDMRSELGRPVVISRGVSCEAHNADVGGASDSRHLPQHADAVDVVASSSREAYQVVEQAMGCEKDYETPWRAIRVYKHHVHLDARPGPRIFIASPE